MVNKTKNIIGLTQNLTDHRQVNVFLADENYDRLLKIMHMLLCSANMK